VICDPFIFFCWITECVAEIIPSDGCDPSDGFAFDIVIANLTESQWKVVHVCARFCAIAFDARNVCRLRVAHCFIIALRLQHIAHRFLHATLLHFEQLVEKFKKPTGSPGRPSFQASHKG
jgi:hypothetical protein